MIGRICFRRSLIICFVSFIAMLAAAGQVLASGGGGSEGAAGAVYVTFKPALITNFGGPGRVKYIKADMSIRLESAAVADAVQHNMPLIRNNILNIMAKQTDETLSGQPGKEALRQEALKEIQAIVKQQSQLEGVLDLFFNSIVVQK